MKVNIIKDPPGDSFVTDFVSGKIAIISGGSGFWAQDPIGDVAMWFTPNLHKTMTFTWSDRELHKRISELENAVDPIKLKNELESFNRYVYERSIIAPVVHFRRFYISSKHIKNLNIPQAVTAPAPWQLVPEL
jgi:hypothetical protein